jgi:hypothetical protein
MVDPKSGRRSKYSSGEGSTDHIEYFEEKKGRVNVIEKVDSSSSEEDFHTRPVQSAKDLVTEVIRAEDDPTLNPWTFRTWFLGKYGSLH